MTKSEATMAIKRDKIPIFPNGARVCFVGDSLTAGAVWTQLIHEYYLKQNPECNIRMYNSGIGGATLWSAAKFLDDNVFVWNPTHVVIAFGGNDIKLINGTPKERVEQFKESLRNFSRVFTDRGITVYYLAEPNYDYDKQDADGTNSLILKMGVEQICEEQDTYFCDIYTLFTPYLQNYHDTVIKPDGVHFTYDGECVVAKLFLYSQGFDIDISNDELMLKKEEFSRFGTRKHFFDRRLRLMWLAEQLLFEDMYASSVEEKFEKARHTITDWRASTETEWWVEMKYYRALDYLEVRPFRDFYVDAVKEAADCMIEDAIKCVKIQ